MLGVDGCSPFTRTVSSTKTWTIGVSEGSPAASACTRKHTAASSKSQDCQTAVTTKQFQTLTNSVITACAMGGLGYTWRCSVQPSDDFWL